MLWIKLEIFTILQYLDNTGDKIVFLDFKMTKKTKSNAHVLQFFHTHILHGTWKHTFLISSLIDNIVTTWTYVKF